MTNKRINIPGAKLQVVIGKRYKRVTMQRTLLSKLYWDRKEFLLQDIIALYENQIYLEMLALRDPSFAQTFGKHLESLSLLLKQTKVPEEHRIKKLARNLRTWMKSHEEILYPRRNLEAQWKRYKRFVSFRSFSQPGTPNRELPPVKFIGKGYTDKGTAKKPHLDGSPSWQEVASATRRTNEAVKSQDVDSIKRIQRYAEFISEQDRDFPGNR